MFLKSSSVNQSAIWKLVFEKHLKCHMAEGRNQLCISVGRKSFKLESLDTYSDQSVHYLMHYLLSFKIQSSIQNIRCGTWTDWCRSIFPPHVLPHGTSVTYFLGLPRSSKARSCRLWLREAEGACDAPGGVKTCDGGTGVAKWAGEARLSDWGRAAGSVVVSTELGGCGNVTDAVEMDSVETIDVENKGPGKFKAEEVVDEDLVKLTVASGKSEDVEHAGTEDEVMSKRAKSWLDSWNAW